MDGHGEFVPEITTSVITLGLCYLVLSDSQNASKLDHIFYDTSSVPFFPFSFMIQPVSRSVHHLSGEHFPRSSFIFLSVV